MKNATVITLLSIAAVLLFVGDIALGSVYIPIDELWALLSNQADALTSTIILDFRLPKAVVAILAGASLSCSGLQMQTLFRNPLAGPYVLGVSSGACFGVALLLLGAPLFGEFFDLDVVRDLGITGAAWIGSSVVLLVVMAVASRLKDIMTILILGMMIGSGVGAVVEIMQFLSPDNAVKSFVVWTMGSLGGVSSQQLLIMTIITLIGLFMGVMMIKPLNLLLLGENYAKTMGLNANLTRTTIFASTILLAGTITAFCGPIGFVGIVAPHIARMVIRNADHRILMPTTILCGVVMMLFCDILSQLPGTETALPINTITSLLGIPMILIIVLRGRGISRM